MGKGTNGSEAIFLIDRGYTIDIYDSRESDSVSRAVSGSVAGVIMERFSSCDMVVSSKSLDEASIGESIIYGNSKGDTTDSSSN